MKLNANLDMSTNGILRVSSLTNTLGPLTITAAGTSTWSTSSGALTLQAATALNLTGTTSSTWTIGAGVLTITSADFKADATGVHDTAIGQSGTPQAGTFSNLVGTGSLTLEQDNTQVVAGNSVTVNATSGVFSDATVIAANADRADITFTDSRILNSNTRIYVSVASGMSGTAALVVSAAATGPNTGIISVHNGGVGTQNTTYYITFLIVN